MSILDELLKFIGQGNISGLPPIVVMAIPFVLGLVVGSLVKKILKIALIAGVILIVVTYFGFFNLTQDWLGTMINQYGPQVITYATFLLGMLPLTTGFVIGFAIALFFT